MKILFLDHQGVMYTKKHPSPGILDNFDIECVDVLNYILERNPDLEIVVSSDWKYWVSLEEMQSFYKKQGIIKVPIDYTRKTDIYCINILAFQRSNEIKDWLSVNITNITKWVAVDDLDMRKYLENFIFISEPLIGIKDENTKSEIMNCIN